MKENAAPVKLPRHPKIWWSRIKTKWPFLVWISAVILAFYFYAVGVDMAAFVGHVEAIDLPISPVEDSKIQSLAVKVGDTVTNGQIIAQMVSSLITAEIAVNEALAIENTATATDRILSLYNSYQRAVSDAESQLQSETVARGEKEGELKATTAELKRLRKLIDDKVLTVDSTIISRLVTQEASLRDAVRLYPDTIIAIEKRISDARAGITSVKKWLSIDSETEITEALIERTHTNAGSPIQQVALLRQRLEQYTLRSSYNGTIAHLYERPGNVIARGTPIATVLVASDRVIGFLPEVFAKEPELGMTASIYRRSGTSMEPIPAVVTTMAPRIEPTTITGPSGQSLRGRRIYLTTTRTGDLIPGETVDIQLASRSSPWLRAIRELILPLRSLFSESSAQAKSAN